MANSLELSIDGEASASYEVVRIAGYEGLSQPSVYEMTLLSKDGDVKPPSILGKKLDVKHTFIGADKKKHERFCSGIAVRLIRGRKHDRFYEYQVTVRSWFWLLTKKQNSRIFQDQTVLEIVDSVFSEKPINEFKEIDIAGVTQKHTKRNYCVQYQETDFDFVSRLLESEGIYYWFDCYDKHGLMRLSDSSVDEAKPLPAEAILTSVPNGASEPRFNQISSWHISDRIDSNAFAGQDVSYRSVATPQVGEAAVTIYFDGGLENYEYPYGYTINEGSPESSEFTLSVEEDATLTDARLHELASRRKRNWVSTHWPDVTAGSTFTYEGTKNDARNGEYLIANCAFMLSDSASSSSHGKDTDGSAPSLVLQSLRDDPVHFGTTEYVESLISKVGVFADQLHTKNSFFLTLLSHKSTFSPQRNTQRKVMPGPQTAVVVGGEGEELKVDKLGRVKVKFFWERERTKKDNTSCWIRVSQPMAGQGWGGYFAPRVGQEVIVDFLNGDPDKPIIVGRVYNDFNDIPYQSPTQSGFKTRSTPKGAASDYNEIRFEDKKGAEELSLHGQKNVSITAEANQSTSVGADQGTNVGHNRTVSVGNNETNLVKVDQSNYVGGMQNSVTVGMQSNYINADQFTKVTGEQTVIANGGQKIKAKGQYTKVQGFRKLDVTENDDIGITGFQTTKVGSDYAVLATGNIKLKADGKRLDVTSADHWVLTDAAYKLSANSGIQFMTPASIDSTSLGSNTTVLGPNSSGYIGSNSGFLLGLSRSTFIGGSMNNTVGIATSNFGGLSADNFMGIKLSSALGASVDSSTLRSYKQGLFSVMAGADAAQLSAGAGGDALAILHVVIAFAGVGVGIFDAVQTNSQYEAAKEQLRAAAKMAKAEKLTKLAARLDALADSGAAVHLGVSEPAVAPEAGGGTNPSTVGSAPFTRYPPDSTELDKANIDKSNAKSEAERAENQRKADAHELDKAVESNSKSDTPETRKSVEDAQNRLEKSTDRSEQANDRARDAATNANEKAVDAKTADIQGKAKKAFPEPPKQK
jgi:type VI secretion system secreted protein VgrG